MKIIIGIALVGFLTSFLNFSIDEELETENNCDCELLQTANNYFGEYDIQSTDLIQVKELSNLEIQTIAAKLCVNVKLASAGGFKPEKFKNIIFDALEVDRNESTEVKNEILSIFLNQNKQKLVCPKNRDKANDRDRHVYKTAILSGVFDLFDEILLDDDLYDIDFNAFEIVDGKKETVVDYINKLIETGQYTNEDLELLRDDIIDLGGKKGNELE